MRISTLGRTPLLAAFALVALSACDGNEGRTASTPGLGEDGEPEEDAVVTFLEEGEYGPIAQYLVNNANTPLPEPDDGGGEDDAGDGGADDDGSADDSGTPPDEPATCDGFSCGDGECIDASWKCDELTDCADGSDEADCGMTDDSGGGAPCDGFACGDGECIEAGWECDGIVDCSAGEDEANCEGGGDDGGGGGTCDGFTCDDGQCIDATWVCDDVIDCPGSEDEAACGRVDDRRAYDLAQPLDPVALDASCIVTWTTTGAVAGAAAAEVATKACEGGGIVVGFVTAGGGFAAAAVCGAADVAFVDTVAGGLIGALGGLTGSVYYCEGGIRDQATSLLTSLIGGNSNAVPRFQVETGTSAKKCGVPLEVPRSGDEAQCSNMHDEMKEFGFNNPHECSVDFGNLGSDPQVLADTCNDIKRRFQNASDLADKRLEIGNACYDNGNQGPMGNSDFGHQVAWCSVHRSMANCVAQAKHPKLAAAGCDLTPTMRNHGDPPGCGNVLSCG